MTTLTILAALAQLDMTNDAHWTQEGLPRIDVLEKLLGTDVKRQEVTDVDPTFTRALLLAAANSEDTTSADPEDTTSADPEDTTDGTGANIDEPDYEDDSVVSLETLREQEAELKDLVKEGHTFIGAAKKRIAELEVDLVAVQKAIIAMAPMSSNAEAINDYIKSQNKSRADRYERRKLVESQVDLSTLNVRSPLDQAMARKNTRGASRPGTK